MAAKALFISAEPDFIFCVISHKPAFIVCALALAVHNSRLVAIVRDKFFTSIFRLRKLKIGCYKIVANLQRQSTCDQSTVRDAHQTSNSAGMPKRAVALKKLM